MKPPEPRRYWTRSGEGGAAGGVLGFEAFGGIAWAEKVNGEIGGEVVGAGVAGGVEEPGGEEDAESGGVQEAQGYGGMKEEAGGEFVPAVAGEAGTEVVAVVVSGVAGDGAEIGFAREDGEEQLAEFGG
jgi:hypothetical protein